MNRMEEYNGLLSELNFTPPALDDTVGRARIRLKKRRNVRLLTVPAGGLAAFMAVFIFMVNVSTTFAMACGRIPLIRDLAAAVSFSPSLSAAVANEYVQPIDLEQSENGITMRIEYVIVDQRQLNIFYTLDSELYSKLDATPSISALDGRALQGYTISSGNYGIPNGGLCHFSVHFIDKDVPDGLTLTCRVHDKGGDAETASRQISDSQASVAEEYAEPATIATFTFPLNFDPTYTRQGELIELNQAFELGGQKLTLVSVELYPTNIRLNLRGDDNNTAWLKSLICYLEDEKGRRFDKVGNGITATGDPDSPMMSSYWLESPFFSGSKELTLTVTGAVWLDKDKERIRVDLAGKTSEALPEGVVLEKAVRTGNSWQLTFSGQCRRENSTYQLFLMDYYDEVGNKYSYNASFSTSSGYWDEETQEYVETPGRFSESFTLADYPYDVVYLSPAFTSTAVPDSPVVIRVK